MIPSRLKDYMPKHRIENPISAFYEVGDIVRMLIGPAKGRYGIVVVERNANYIDMNLGASTEGIGVASIEKIEVDPVLQDKLDITLEETTETVIRWFYSQTNLEMVSCSKD